MRSENEKGKLGGKKEALEDDHVPTKAGVLQLHPYLFGGTETFF